MRLALLITVLSAGVTLSPRSAAAPSKAASPEAVDLNAVHLEAAPLNALIPQAGAGGSQAGAGGSPLLSTQEPAADEKETAKQRAAREKAAVKKLTDGLRSEEANERQAALVDAAKTPYPEVIKVFGKVLEGKSNDLAMIAAELLGQMTEEQGPRRAAPLCDATQEGARKEPRPAGGGDPRHGSTPVFRGHPAPDQGRL